MKVLTDQELEKIEGGGFSVWAGCAIAAIVTLLAGIIDGFTRPLKCN